MLRFVIPTDVINRPKAQTPRNIVCHSVFGIFVAIVHVRLYFIQVLLYMCILYNKPVMWFSPCSILKSYIHIKLMFMFGMQVFIQITSKYIDLLLFMVNACTISAIYMCCMTMCKTINCIYKGDRVCATGRMFSFKYKSRRELYRRETLLRNRILTYITRHI